MDVFDAVRIVLRRWYVVLPVLIVTVVAVALAYRSADVEYTASSSVGVAGPSIVRSEPTTDGTVATNSLLANGGTTLLANLLSIRLQDPEAASAVVATGGTSGYTVEVLTRSTVTQLPVVSITATGPSAISVTRTLDAVNAQADVALAAVQAAAGVPTALYAKSYVVQSASAPVAGSPDRTRTAAVVGVVGLIVAVLVAALLDAVSNRRRRVDRARHGE